MVATSSPASGPILVQQNVCGRAPIVMVRLGGLCNNCYCITIMNRNDVARRRSMLRILQQRLREDKRSDSEIARAAKISQPTVSRLRSSTTERLRWSKPFNKLCSMYGVRDAQQGADAPD